MTITHCNASGSFPKAKSENSNWVSPCPLHVLNDAQFHKVNSNCGLMKRSLTWDGHWGTPLGKLGEVTHGHLGSPLPTPNHQAKSVFFKTDSLKPCKPWKPWETTMETPWTQKHTHILNQKRGRRGKNPKKSTHEPPTFGLAPRFLPWNRSPSEPACALATPDLLCLPREQEGPPRTPREARGTLFFL